MKNIQEKFSEVYNREEKIGDIFLKRSGKEDREWLILGYMTRMLKLGQELYPVYADKTEPPEPDFITYDTDKKLFFPIEITEIHRPKRKRGDEYKELQKAEKEWDKLTEEEQEAEAKTVEFISGRGLLDKSEWISQITNALSDKYLKRYNPETWLLIYFNILYVDIALYGWWHSTMEYIVKELLKEYKDLQQPPYSRILMVDSSGDSMIQIFPDVYTIKEEEVRELGTNRDLSEW